MKILYLINYDLNENSGVVNKIKQQVSMWKIDNIVYLFSIKSLTLYDENFNPIYNKFKIPNLLNKKGKFFTFSRLLYNSYKLSDAIEDLDIDIIYMRYILYVPFLSKVLKRYKVIMEINSDDVLEYKLNSKLTYYYNLITRDKILKEIDGFVAVSSELKDKFLKYKKPIDIIANGIDTREYHYILETNNDKPILVFIGTPNQSWHGVDKIETMAQYFYDYQFYIIGISKNNTSNIRYFGYLDNKEATKIVSKCDIGIGTLSLYKKSLNEASPLKTRQYFACALPVIYAYDDTDIKGDIDFCLKLDNSEDNLDYDKIDKFVKRVYKKNSYRKEAREFAENILDYSKKEKKRVSFFERILDYV